MGQERIDIAISERGSRVVRRDIAAIGTTSKKASKGVGFLKSALLGIGGALGIRELARFLDINTELRNKLIATGTAGSKLEGVYKQLLDISNNTRQSFEGTVTTYSRLAVGAEQLGLKQEELIGFTTSLNQAIAVSGATSIEAENAMVQLAQGMAAGALRGEELNSVLEQLPTVADVIAKEMGITRGELKNVAEQGKITAKVIIEAFKNARVELAEKFAKSVPTIGQSMAVLRNQFIVTVAEMDKVLDVSGKISVALLLLAINLPALGAALIDVGKALIVVTSAYLAFIASQKVGAIISAIGNWVTYRKAVAAGTVVTLGSAEAERQRAAALLASSVAASGSTATAARAAAATTAQTAAQLAGTQATAMQLAAERQSLAASLQGQITAQARTRTIAKLAEVRLAEASVMAQATRQEAALTTARAAGAAADAARARGLASVAAAQTASSAAAAKAAGSTSLFGQALAGARGAATGLSAALAANPIGLAVVAVVAAVTALVLFSDKISLGIDKVTSLSDLFTALGRSTKKVFNELSAAVEKAFIPIRKIIPEWALEVDLSLANMILGIAKRADSIVGTFVGVVSAIVTVFRELPDAIPAIFEEALNTSLQGIEDFVNNSIDLLNKVREFGGLSPLENVDFKIPQESNSAAKELGADVARSFNAGFDSQTTAQNAVKDILAEAQGIAKARIKAESLANKKDDSKDVSGGPKGGTSKQQTALDKLRGSLDASFKAKKDLAEATLILNNAEKAGILTTEKKAQLTELVNNKLRDQIDPLAAVNRGLDEESKLLELSSTQRELQVQTMAVVQDLKNEGIILTSQEIDQLKEKIALRNDAQKKGDLEASLLEQLNGAKRDQLGLDQAIMDLKNNGDITPQQADSLVLSQNSDLLGGTDLATQAAIEAEQAKFDRIAELRDQGLISEQVAAQAKDNIEKQSFQNRLKSASDYFGQIATLSRSKNKELAAIGKAAALAQAVVDGVAATQKALLAAPPPFNFALAALVGAAAAANVAEIAATTPGFAFGGDFTVGGQGATDSQNVAFRATPGETVSISTPTQNNEKERQAGNGKQSSGNGVTIVNLLDPSLLEDYLTSQEGEESIINTITRNADAVRVAVEGE